MPRTAAPRVLAATTALAALAITSPLVAQAGVRTTFYGSVYGSTVKVGTVANSGRTSYKTMCTADTAYTTGANAAGFSLPDIADIGAVSTRVRSSKGSSGIASTSTTSTGAVDLLDGQITADAITTTAKVKKNANGSYTTTGSSVFTNLVVNGTPVTVEDDFQEITIPNVATVRLNAQSTSTAYGGHAQFVTALRVAVLATVSRPAGEIVVGSTAARLAPPNNRRAYGSAYGTRLSAVGSTLTSGPTASVYIPCGGTDETTIEENNTAGVNVPNVLTAGATTTSATSSDTATKTVATTTADVADVDLLDGVVTAESVTAKAKTTATTAGTTSSSAGTTVVGLAINGTASNLSSAENTDRGISGIGGLHLRTVTRTATGITVIAAQLELTSAQGSLGAGTRLNIGVAKSGVRP